MDKTFQIMDVTCRDGSYAINFQLSTAAEKNICCGLEALGFEYIEVGHGIGLGASRKNHGKALHTDEEYLACAQENLHKAQYGVFCIPGVADLEDVDLAAEYGCGFIRIGCNVEDIDKTEPYIKRAIAKGLTVMSNYMKSYATPIQQFEEAVKKSEAWGADLVYIVDSAGSMLPTDVERYYNAIKKISNIRTGFHGHDNIGMALANSIHAVELGVDFIDASLQGLGRSSGNTVMETLVICLQKMGYNFPIDEIALLYLGRQYVYPLMKGRGINPIDIECGAPGFHSSYLQDIHKISAQFEVDPLLLIRKYSKIDKVNMDVEKLAKIAKGLPGNKNSGYLLNMVDYFGGEQDSNNGG